MDERREAVGILYSMKDACPDLDILLEYPSNAATWAGLPIPMMHWMIEAFAANPREARRLFAACDAAAGFFAEFRRYCAARGIPAQMPPRRFIEAQRRAMLHAVFPTWQDVARNATGGMSERTARELLLRVGNGVDHG